MISAAQSFFVLFRLNLAGLLVQWWPSTSCHHYPCRLLTRPSFHVEHIKHTHDVLACETWQCLSLLVFEGTEVIPGLSSRSCRETGFTQRVVAPLTHPVSTDTILISRSSFELTSLTSSPCCSSPPFCSHHSRNVRHPLRRAWERRWHTFPLGPPSVLGAASLLF